MAFFDNSNWVRSMLATQAGNLQGQFAPNGEMWQQYLNAVNPLMNSVNGMLNPSQAMLWGGTGMPGYMDSLMNYGNALPGLLNSLTGGTGQAQEYLNFMGGNLSNLGNMANAAFGMATNPQQSPLQQFIENQLTGFVGGGNPLQNMLGETGYGLMAGGGSTPYTQGMGDVGNYFLQQGGMTDPLRQGVSMAGQGGAAGMNLLNTGGLNQLPGLKDAIGFGQNTLANGGMNNFLGMGEGGIGNILGNQGQMGSINALQKSLLPEIQSGGYGKLQPGFDTAISMMNGGNISPYTQKGADLALQFASGGGPSLMSGMGGLSMPSFSAPSISISGPGSVSRGAVDSGYTQSIDEMISKAKEILDQNPLIPMDKAINMARDQAGTAMSQNMEAMMRRALQRGNQGASNVTSGLSNQAMADFANEGSQAEAAAMRDAMMKQQGLQLQKYGIGADLSKAMEQVAAGRNASSSQLAGQEMSANAQLQAAYMSAQAQAASQNAQMQFAAQQAQADMFKTMATLNNQRQMSGLQSLLGFSGQQNDQMMGGLNAMAGLQNSANNRLGIASDAFLKGSDIQSGRELQALGLIPGMSNAQNNNLNTGLSAITQPANILSQNMGTGANLFSNMTSALPGMQNSANNLLGTAGNLITGAGGLELNRLTGGAGMAQNGIGNLFTGLNGAQNLANAQGQQATGALGIGNSLMQTLMGGANNAFGNSMQLPGFGLSQFNALTGAMSPFYSSWNQGIGNLYNGISNSNNILGQLAGQNLGYMGTGMSGYAGLNAGSGNGSLFNSIGSFIGNLGQAAQGAGAMGYKPSDSRLKDNQRDTEKGIETIDKLKVKDYEWKDTGKTETGLIAQELNEVVPYAVLEGDENNIWKVDYAKLVPILIKAVQELKAEIEKLKENK